MNQALYDAVHKISWNQDEVEQSGNAVAIATPFDADLARLSADKGIEG